LEVFAIIAILLKLKSLDWFYEDKNKQGMGL
jgi:hypothetical protein